MGEPSLMGGKGGHPTTNTGELRLTYAQLAARLGISGEAARQLVRRRQWRRIQPNRMGAPAIIVVPEEELAAETWRQERPTPPDAGETEADVPPSPPNGAAVLDQFERERAALKGQIDALRSETQALMGLVAEIRSERDRERQRADHAFGMIDEFKADKSRETARAERAEQALAGERNQADALRDSLEVANTGARQVAEAHSSQLAELRVIADQARAEMEELRQADAERKARGRWTRLRAAWRGE
jgi:hypothetical protein